MDLLNKLGKKKYNQRNINQHSSTNHLIID